MRALAEEQQRLEQEQLALRADAEEEMKAIDPEIEALRETIREAEKEIEALEAKRKDIANFIAKMNVKSAGHPLRRNQAA